MDGQTEQCTHTEGGHEPAHYELPCDRYSTIHTFVSFIAKTTSNLSRSLSQLTFLNLQLVSTYRSRITHFSLIYPVDFSCDFDGLTLVCVCAEGFKEAAEKFRMESGIEPSVDLDSLDERIKIRELILKGQIQEAIALINSLHPELLDTKRYLYFHLQQQHLIELIRLQETESALEFAQTQLAEQGEESRECLTEMERTLALLAFDNPEESPFGDLLNMMQRQKVWSEVNQAVLDYENRESTPKLAKLLKLLLWAQNELDQKKVKYPKMTDLSKGTIEDPK
uniref:GID complex subunit 8 homolog n=1 Tax=Oncorhynchus kisutch TaxID=8019 RepID=A0A8C7DQK4_ONCKI